MKRLFIDILPYEYGKSFGYQEYICNLLDYFYAHDSDILFDQIIIVCLDSQCKYFSKYSERIFIKTYACKSILKRMFIQTLLPLYLGVRKHDIIVYTANYSSLIKRCRHILVVHDLLFKRKSLFPYPLMRFQRTLYLPISLKLADKVIAISEFTAADIEHFYPGSKEKTFVIYNFFNFDKFSLINQSVSKEKVFVTVCSTAYHKNTQTVIKAFKEYCLKGGSYDLILVGSLKIHTFLYDQFELLDASIKSRIHLYDKVSNIKLAELYQKSQAYISASLFEGLGMPTVEAMYFDLPIIISDYPIFREVSQNRGIYFDPLNSDELAGIMMSIEINQPTFSYSDSVKEIYSAEQTSKKYIQLINSFA